MDEIRVSVALGEELIGVGVFFAIVLVFWLAKRVKDHPKVTPAYKIEKKGKVTKHG